MLDAFLFFNKQTNKHLLDIKEMRNIVRGSFFKHFSSGKYFKVVGVEEYDYNYASKYVMIRFVDEMNLKVHGLPLKSFNQKLIVDKSGQKVAVELFEEIKQPTFELQKQFSKPIDERIEKFFDSLDYKLYRKGSVKDKTVFYKHLHQKINEEFGHEEESVKKKVLCKLFTVMLQKLTL